MACEWQERHNSRNKDWNSKGIVVTNKRKRGCLWLAGGVLVLLLVAAVAVYLLYGRQVNLAGVIGEGEAVAVAVPEGFRVTIFAQGLNGPRFMALGPDAVIYVADRGNDRIVALPDANQDGEADEIRVFADGPLRRFHLQRLRRRGSTPGSDRCFRWS